MKLLLIWGLWFLAGAQAFAAFPSEDQVRRTLTLGMTSDEVIARFGTPGELRGDPDERTLVYLSPLETRTLEVEGYVGFKMIFRNGRLVDWRPIKATPSYDPDLHPREHLMPLAWTWGLMFLAIFGFGIFKAFRFATSEHRQIIEAFKERTIPTQSLPPDFRFIDHETTLQEVIDRVGPWTRATKRVTRGVAAGYRTIEAGDGLPGIITYEFEMPTAPKSS